MDLHDAMADVICNYEPLEEGGMAHRGVLLCAKNKFQVLEEPIQRACKLYPDYGLVFTGHSLGAATAGLLGHLWKQKYPDIPFKMHLYGCPPILDKENSLKYIDDSIVYIHRDDIIPRLTFGSLYDLKGMIQGVLKDNPKVGQKFWQIIAAGGNLPKSWQESGNKKYVKSGINLTKIKEAKINQKIYGPGKVVFLFNPRAETAKNWYADYSEPVCFDEIVLSVSMYLDHMPDGYERGFRRSLRRLNQLREAGEYPPKPPKMDVPETPKEGETQTAEEQLDEILAQVQNNANPTESTTEKK